MKSPDRAPTGLDARNAELLVHIVGNLVRASVADAIPILVAQLAPALVEVLERSLRGWTPTAGAAPYLTVKEAAVMMGCHPTTVRRLVRDGKLGRYLLEGDVRIRVSDIHAYLARSGARSPSIDLAERALAIMGVRDAGGHDRG